MAETCDACYEVILPGERNPELKGRLHDRCREMVGGLREWLGLAPRTPRAPRTPLPIGCPGCGRPVLEAERAPVLRRRWHATCRASYRASSAEKRRARHERWVSRIAAARITAPVGAQAFDVLVAPVGADKFAMEEEES